jgi:hypothetical protein
MLCDCSICNMLISPLTYHKEIQMDYVVFLRIVLRLLVTADVVPRSPILVILMMEDIRSSETSALTIATRRHIPKDCILHVHSRENLKSYIALTGWAL